MIEIRERESTDRIYREKAVELHKKIVQALKRPEKVLKFIQDIIPYLEVGDIDPEYSDLDIQFWEKGYRSPAKARNKQTGKHVIIMPVTKSDIDPLDDISGRMELAKSSFVHEFIHYLDDKRRTSPSTGTINKLTGNNRAAYYNTPEEFNAFYQENLDEVWYVFRSLDKYTRSHFLKSFDTFYKWVTTQIMRDEFVNLLNSTYTRKLQKRLYDLYTEVRNEFK